MKIDYFRVNVVNKKRCPYFYGSKEYGNNLSIELDIESWDKLEFHYEHKFKGWQTSRLNLFENGVISVSRLSYNTREEEWEENEEYVFKDNEITEMISLIDSMLAISPIARIIDNIKIRSYKELINFLKKGDF